MGCRQHVLFLVADPARVQTVFFLAYITRVDADHSESQSVTRLLSQANLQVALLSRILQIL
jgi:hypothetical protein